MSDHSEDKGEKKVRIQVVEHEISPDSAAGKMLGLLAEKLMSEEDKHPHEKGQDCDDPDCKLCTGGVRKYRNLTRDEALKHLEDTSYVPQVLDVVKLNQFGASSLKFLNGVEEMTVLRVLPQKLYGTDDLYSSRAGIGFDCLLGCKKTSGQIIEMLYPSTHLELVHRAEK